MWLSLPSLNTFGVFFWSGVRLWPGICPGNREGPHYNVTLAIRSLGDQLVISSLRGLREAVTPFKIHLQSEDENAGLLLQGSWKCLSVSSCISLFLSFEPNDILRWRKIPILPVYKSFSVFNSLQVILFCFSPATVFQSGNIIIVSFNPTPICFTHLRTPSSLMTFWQGIKTFFFHLACVLRVVVCSLYLCNGTWL